MKNGIALALLAMFATAVLCTAVQANVVESLPDVFLSGLAEIKAKTTVPVLLPSELPRPFNDAKHATVGATADDYAVSLYYELAQGTLASPPRSGLPSNPASPYGNWRMIAK